MKTFVHRCNNIQYLYLLYWLRNARSYEIDVQATRDGIIVLYHDDCSHLTHTELENIFKQPVYTLAEFLRCTPENITLNIEIKNYNVGKDNTIKIVNDILSICQTYMSNKSIIYSSFDQDIVRHLKGLGLDHWWLVSEGNMLHDNTFEDICVNIDILDEALEKVNQDVNISVYGLNERDLIRYSINDKYTRVNNWIIDYICTY